jgi:hypothetical protein
MPNENLKVKKDGIGVEKTSKNIGDVNEFLKEERKRTMPRMGKRIKEDIDRIVDTFPERRAAHSIVRFENGMPVPLEEVIISMKAAGIDKIETDDFVFTLK